MKFFVTGVGGQLGHDVMNELLKRGHEGVGSDIQENYSGVADGSAVTKAPYVALDITDKDVVEKVITEVNPDAVIHCAAWTAVDMAEDDDKVAKVRAINAGGTQNIANVCKKLDCKMTYISTDYVFDGQGTEPWQPDCKDYKPLNVYGQTKLEGELAVSQTLEKYFIVRIAWVFGLNGKNFIKTMLNVGKTHDTVRVVNDQIGTPTYTYDLARLLVDMNETEKYGYYHATNEGGYIQLAIRDLPDRTSVAIKNSGAGIAADEIALIFERFYKTDKSRSQDKNGMGLGLYIVRTIIKLHGGEITVQSVENEYCQFEFWLPKHEEPKLKAGKKEKDPAKDKKEEKR